MLSADIRLITLTETLIIPDTTKTEYNNCFIIHCFEENNDKRLAAITESRSHSYFAFRELDIAVRKLDIALGNHALHGQPTDYSLILNNL